MLSAELKKLQKSYWLVEKSQLWQSHTYFKDSSFPGELFAQVFDSLSRWSVRLWYFYHTFARCRRRQCRRRWRLHLRGGGGFVQTVQVRRQNNGSSATSRQSGAHFAAALNHRGGTWTRSPLAGGALVVDCSWRHVAFIIWHDKKQVCRDGSATTGSSIVFMYKSDGRAIATGVVGLDGRLVPLGYAIDWKIDIFY